MPPDRPAARPAGDANTTPAGRRPPGRNPARRAGLGLLVGVLFVLVAPGAFGAPGLEPTAAVSFTLHGNLSGWGFTANAITSPGPTLTVNLGDSVTMRLFSEDQNPHTFFVDYDGDRQPETGEPRSAVFSSRTVALVYTFTADRAGSFTYWCDLHFGRMVGSFIVQGAANTAPTVMAVAGTPSSVIPGQEITFTATIGDVDGDVVSYTWMFGDGATSSGTTPAGGGSVSAVHAYETTGMKTATLSASDGKGGTASGSGTITVVQPGLLRVTTNPPVPGKILVDGASRDEWGTNWVKIAPGGHEVSFGEVHGTRAPGPQTVQVTAGMTTEAVGEYLVYGSLRVTTEPAVPATVFVNGEPSNDWGMWRAVPPGEYTISFGRVEGYDPPAASTVTIASGGFEHVVGRFTANPSAPGPSQTFGYLRVTTSPPIGATIAVDGIDRDDWGLNWVKMSAGSHIVQFRGAYGYTTPAPIPVTISLGVTTEVTGVYVPHGFLRVQTNPAVPATVFVNNIPRDDWGMWQSFLPGSYRITFGPVAGYTTPGPQTAVVTAGATAMITGTYSSVGVGASPETADCCTESCCDCCGCGTTCHPHGG